MDKKTIMSLRGRAQTLKATVHLGKEGVTDSVLNELASQLKKQKLVKVRVLPSAESESREIARELAARTEAVLIEIRGHTIVLARDG